MKKILVVVVALASMNAFATRARVNALGNSPHLMDTQTVYGNPADMMMMGDYVTMESGTTAGGAQNANAEGMVTRSMGDAKMGLSLGHQSKNASLWGLRQALTLGGFPSRTATVGNQQNPVELSYGMKSADMAWGATLVYSNYNDKTALAEKESSAGLRGGLRMGALDAKVGLGLLNTYENATDGKYKGTLGVSASVGYAMDNLYVYGGTEMAGFKAENATSVEFAKYSLTAFNVGAISSHKKDGSEFFYGAAIEKTDSKLETTPDSTLSTKTSTLALPITMGLEVDAATWLTLRGSVTQKTIINSSKREANETLGTPAETAPGVNSTSASVGAGLKWNQLTLDGSLTGLTGATASQNINGTDLLGQVGVTYMF
jgi:hypothetical protein